MTVTTVKDVIGYKLFNRYFQLHEFSSKNQWLKDFNYLHNVPYLVYKMASAVVIASRQVHVQYTYKLCSVRFTRNLPRKITVI